MRPVYLSIAGIDGSGKSTLAAAVAAELEPAVGRVLRAKTRLSAMLSVFALSERLFGDRHDYDPGIPATLREFVVACDVVRYFQDEIEPALAEGVSVVWDRGPLCYESYARAYGADPQWILAMLGLVTPPGLTVLLDVPADVAHQRVVTRTDKPPLASERPSFLAEVRKQYLTLAADRADVLVLDGTLDVPTLTERVLAVSRRPPTPRP